MDIERLIATYILRPIFKSLGLIFWPITKPVDLILARADEKRLKRDVLSDLPFLFAGRRGRFIPNRDVPYIPSFDYAFVTLALDGIIIRFCRGRGEIDIRIASAAAPQDWYDLPTTLVALDQKAFPDPPEIGDLRHAARLLESNVNLLAIAFSGSDPRFYKRLAGARLDERIRIREAEWELNSAARARRPRGDS